MIYTIRPTPNWQRDIKQRIHALADGDTLLVPHEEAAAFARRLAAAHGKTGVYWLCEVTGGGVAEGASAAGSGARVTRA